MYRMKKRMVSGLVRRDTLIQQWLIKLKHSLFSFNLCITIFNMKELKLMMRRRNIYQRMYLIITIVLMKIVMKMIKVPHDIQSQGKGFVIF